MEVNDIIDNISSIRDEVYNYIVDTEHWVFIPSSETNDNGFHFCDIYDRYELNIRKLWCNGKLKE